MPEVKTTSDQPSSMEARIQKRLGNSGVGHGTNPNSSTKVGNSPNRTITNIHHAAGHLTPNNTSPRGDHWKK
jgi:hypothetical protein